MIISPNKIPLAGYELNSTDDPTLETLSLTLYVSGCPRRCIGCQNEELQKMNNDHITDIEDVKTLILSKKILTKSVVFCGGDFIGFYDEQLIILTKFVKENKLKSILYTGQEYEKLDEWIKNNIDIIISEPFDINRYQSKFPASENQRVFINGIEVDPNTLAINKRN